MQFIRECKERETYRVVEPTVAAFAPLLKKKKAYIKEVAFKTFRYAPGDRGELDVYYPISSMNDRAKTPVLFFIYGGGFNSGQRSISPKSFGLVYACLAAYFARQGFIVIIPDYRVVPNVVFPGPAEDVRDAIRWTVENKDVCLFSESSPNPDVENILLMGHSAGAAHIATMLFLTDVLAENDALRKNIAAIILESPPFDLSAMTPDWPTASVHAAYWGGTLEQAKENDPLHLYKRLNNTIIHQLPKTLMVEAEFEPEWLLDAGEKFNEEVKKRTGQAFKVLTAKGHNHVSLNWALSTGEGEEWAVDVILWLRNHNIIM
ncbi:alpha/beta hydrolase domain-containing protein [Crepidotus variabilis]|uniref:Alpha/beta hydrolase domain-containing protein n=1 Tax=Crepidotus variabilis TaxID=179855 RepID=A0A9P6E937_9AGAR|nr:alpha/beta hydrolase domain-containing protein [Crepidotus variabilis]